MIHVHRNLALFPVKSFWVMLGIIIEITETENFNSIHLFFFFLQDKEVKCELRWKSCVLCNRVLPQSSDVGECTFEFTTVDLFLVLKSNVGFLFSQRFCIYNRIRGRTGTGTLNFPPSHHFRMTNQYINVSVTASSISCQQLFTEQQLTETDKPWKYSNEQKGTQWRPHGAGSLA